MCCHFNDIFYHAKASLRVAILSASVALTLLGAAHEIDDGDARHVMLLIPPVKAETRVLAGLGLVLGWTVTDFDPGCRPQRYGLHLGRIHRSTLMEQIQ